MTSGQGASENSSRRNAIVGAAVHVFERYGYARTTMGDIAEGAGISRPALYLVFPGKDEIFTAVLERMSDDSLGAMRAGMAKFRSLSGKLHYCCETWGTHGFALTELHPAAKDLFDTKTPAVLAMFAAFEAFLAELIEDDVRASRLKATPAEVAQLLVFAMRGFKEIAKDRTDMARMIGLHVDTVIAALKAR